MRALESSMRTALSTGLACAGLLLAAAMSDAEVVLHGYLGKASTGDADVSVALPGDTELTFRDVAWSDESFTGPIYYGLGLVYWLERSPGWGLGLDFTHAKMVARLDETVAVEGIRSGEPVAAREALGETFEGLSFTHGHNLLTFLGTRRWLLGEGPGTGGSRWRPYLGLGVGVAVPHVEATLGGRETYEYQLVGPAAQGLLGAEVSLGGRLSLFGEYKLGWADMEADLDGGGTLRLRPWTNHLAVGLSLGF